MTAKPNIQAVQTPAERMRQAIATIETTLQEVENLRAKAAMFAPIEAEAAAAEAELQTILQADADAMRMWASDGARGAAPEPSNKAREEATRKVSTARAKLNASRGALAEFQGELDRANQRHLNAHAAEKDALRVVLGQELLHRARVVKDAARRYLATEHHYARVKRAALEIGGLDHLLSEAQEITKQFLPPDEVEIAEAARLVCEKRLYALSQGQEPAE
jgi:hypothetical protein